MKSELKTALHIIQASCCLCFTFNLCLKRGEVVLLTCSSELHQGQGAGITPWLHACSILWKTTLKHSAI